MDERRCWRSCPFWRLLFRLLWGFLLLRLVLLGSCSRLLILSRVREDNLLLLLFDFPGIATALSVSHVAHYCLSVCLFALPLARCHFRMEIKQLLSIAQSLF